MINFIIWLIVGGVVGWLASLIMRTDAQQGNFLEHHRRYRRRGTRRMVDLSVAWCAINQSGCLQLWRAGCVVDWSSDSC